MRGRAGRKRGRYKAGRGGKTVPRQGRTRTPGEHANRRPQPDANEYGYGNGDQACDCPPCPAPATCPSLHSLFLATRPAFCRASPSSPSSSVPVATLCHPNALNSTSKPARWRPLRGPCDLRPSWEPAFNDIDPMPTRHTPTLRSRVPRGTAEWRAPCTVHTYCTRILRAARTYIVDQPSRHRPRWRPDAAPVRHCECETSLLNGCPETTSDAGDTEIKIYIGVPSIHNKFEPHTCASIYGGDETGWMYRSRSERVHM